MWTHDGLFKIQTTAESLVFEFLPHWVIVKAGLGSPFSRTTLEKKNQYKVVLRVWQWQWFWDSDSEKDRKAPAPLLLLPRATFGGLHSVATSALTLYGGPSDFVHGTVVITFCYESARACLCWGVCVASNDFSQFYPCPTSPASASFTFCYHPSTTRHSLVTQGSDQIQGA